MCWFHFITVLNCQKKLENFLRYKSKETNNNIATGRISHNDEFYLNWFRRNTYKWIQGEFYCFLYRVDHCPKCFVTISFSQKVYLYKNKTWFCQSSNRCWKTWPLKLFFPTWHFLNIKMKDLIRIFLSRSRDY